jgi:hypothetical protein
MTFLAINVLLPFMSYAIPTIQMSAAYLAIALFASPLAAIGRSTGRATVAFIAGLLLWGAYDVYAAHPNYVGYFNLIAGGPEQGYRWLSDSDQDWGQSLPALRDYQRNQGEPHLLLAYSGSADPRAYGLQFQDLFSPALYIRATRGEIIPNDSKPTWVAISTKVLQTEPQAMAWFGEHLPRRAIVGGCFLIYDITLRPDAYRWVAELYAQTERPRLAQWALQRAKQLELR